MDIDTCFKITYFVLYELVNGLPFPDNTFITKRAHALWNCACDPRTYHLLYNSAENQIRDLTWKYYWTGLGRNFKKWNNVFYQNTISKNLRTCVCIMISIGDKTIFIYLALTELKRVFIYALGIRPFGDSRFHFSLSVTK